MAKKFGFDWGAVKDKIAKDNTKGKGFEKDKRFWEPTKDAEGNGIATIRFLPDLDGNPYIKYYSHSFSYLKNGEKKWWIKNCINTFGYDENCPICKKNQQLYNSAYDSDKAIAGQRKRKLSYISNILVVKDPANPENEGKVFLYRYGQKIYEKLVKPMFPTEQDLMDDEFVQFVPFDLYEGANFLLKIKKQGDFPNYDDSKLQRQSAIAGGDDEKIEAYMNATHRLEEFLERKLYPTNEEVIAAVGHELNMTIDEAPETGGQSTSTAASDEPAFGFQDDEPATSSAGKLSVADEPAPAEDVPFDVDTPAEPAAAGDDLDADAAFFKSLR